MDILTLFVVIPMLTIIGILFTKDQKQVRWVIESIGINHVFWGSDYPYFDQKKSIQILSHYGFKDKLLDKYLYTNAMEFANKYFK